MNKLLIVCTLFALSASNVILSCPICVDRIHDLQEPFFALHRQGYEEQARKTTVNHE